MTVTVDQLASLYETTPRSVLEKYIDPMNYALDYYHIDTTFRLAMFFAQIGAESGGMMHVEENLNYRADRLMVVFPKYFRDVDPNDYARNPEKLANRVYANRMGNGDEYSGDGYKYRGRGFIQLTGKNNYTKFANDIGRDFETITDYVATPEGACISAGWYWHTNHIYSYADRQDIRGATLRINGGYHGLEMRQQIYNEALNIF